MARKCHLTEKQKAPFEKCYQVWNKERRDRGESEKAWMELNPEPEEAEEIFQRILAWNRFWKAEGTQTRFIKYFSRWLKKCTRDDIPSVMEHKKPEESTKVVARWYEEKWQKAAEDYCVGLKLYIRGLTPKKEAKHNMAKHMSEKLGKRTFKKMFPKLAGYL